MAESTALDTARAALERHDATAFAGGGLGDRGQLAGALRALVAEYERVSERLAPNPLHGAEAHRPTWDCFVCSADTLDDVPANTSEQ